uniref:Putative secreted protein n=1 Tax=Amblyomma americanum TaxID=6943 RepID=A0A0C9SE56_AMBAM
MVLSEITKWLALFSALTTSYLFFVEGKDFAEKFLTDDRRIFLVAFTNDSIPSFPDFRCVRSDYPEKSDKMTRKVQYEEADQVSIVEEKLWKRTYKEVTFMLGSEGPNTTLTILDVSPPTYFSHLYIGTFSVVIEHNDCLIVGDKAFDGNGKQRCLAWSHEKTFRSLHKDCKSALQVSCVNTVHIEEKNITDCGYAVRH